MTSKNKNKIIDINKEKNNKFFKSQNIHKKNTDLEKMDTKSVDVNSDSKTEDTKSEDTHSNKKSEINQPDNNSEDSNSDNKSEDLNSDNKSEINQSNNKSELNNSNNKSNMNNFNNKSEEIVLNNRLIKNRLIENRSYETSNDELYESSKKNKNYKINLTRNVDMNNFNNMRNLIINKTSQFKENIYRLNEIQLDRHNQNNYIEISNDKLKELLELAKSRSIDPNNIKYIEKFNSLENFNNLEKSILPVNLENNKLSVNLENNKLPDSNKDITQKDVNNENFVVKFFKNLSFPEFLGLSLVIILLAIFIGNSLRKMTQNVDLTKMIIKPFLKDQA